MTMYPGLQQTLGCNLRTPCVNRRRLRSIAILTLIADDVILSAVKTGKDDGKKAKSYNPQRSHYYHDAGFGNFAEVYRSGFSRGYQEGLQGRRQRASRLGISSFEFRILNF